MRKTIKSLEELLTDITFAEEREFNSSKQALSKIAEIIENTLTAIAFAEEGEFAVATSYATKKGEGQKSQKTKGQITTLCAGRA